MIAQQTDGCRPEDKEATGSTASLSSLINQATQFGKKLRGAVNLVENYQAIFIGSEKQGGVSQLGAVRAGFEIKIKRVCFIDNLKCKGRFADLARTDQRHGGLPAQSFSHRAVRMTYYHPCILKENLLIYKDRFPYGIDHLQIYVGNLSINYL